MSRQRRIPGDSHKALTANGTDDGRERRVQLSFHDGPLPPPEQLERYEKVFPGAAEIIFRNFEAQVQHRQAIERSVVESNVRSQRLGPILGTVLAGLIIVGGFLAVILKGDVRGYAMVLASGAGLVGTALHIRNAQAKERREKEQSLLA